jgi:uncharacterized membrane protein YkoI
MARNVACGSAQHEIHNGWGADTKEHSMRKMILPSALSVLLLSAAPLIAAPMSRSASPAGQEIKSEQPNTTQIKLFRQAKVTLLDAIAAAKNHGGGKLMDVSFDVSDGKPVYKVKTYQNNEVWEAALDALSGQFVDQGTITPENQLDEEDRAELAGLQQATVALAQAVDAAEKSIGGKAMNAGLEETNGKVVYEISVVQKTGFVKKVMVDPKTGQLRV